MNLLAFDTSTELLSIALLAHGKITTFEQVAGPKASELILPQIKTLMDTAKVTLNDLDGIAFGAGPGAFTGVRIACGVAQGLGFGANIPVVGINTLHAVAQASGAQKVIAALDARMGEIYFAALEKQGDTWVEVSPTALYKPENLPDVTGHWFGAGNAWAVYGDALQARYDQAMMQVQAGVAPSAEAILQLAQPVFAAGKAKPASEAAPIYIRNRVALTAAEREQGQRL